MIEMVQAAVLMPPGYPGGDELMRSAQQGPDRLLTRAAACEPESVIRPS